MDYAKVYPEAYGPLPLSHRLQGYVRHAALSCLGTISRPSAEPVLRLLYCHHVFDDECGYFARTLDHLSDFGDFISTRDVVDVVSGKRALTRHAFHLSFDDSQKNIVTNALPIAQERNIPALLFVPLLAISDPGRFPYLEELIPEGPKKLEYASWADLEKAHAQGLEIGSHTRSHVRLARISDSEARLQDEVAGSREELIHRFGSCDYFSWPYGRREDVDEKSLKLVQDAGYKACVGAYRGRVVPGVTSLFNIPRHHFEPHWPLSHIRYFAHGGREDG